jgi:MYXO-CTERM domain-containing protein
LRGPTLLPKSWYAPTPYEDRTLPIIATTDKFSFDPAAVEDDRLAGPVSLPSGLQPFATNIAGGPYLVHVGGGARVVGRTEAGNLVLQRTTNGSQPVPIELSAQLSAPVLLGRITTAASAALLLALALAAAVRRRRRRSAAHPTF